MFSNHISMHIFMIICYALLCEILWSYILIIQMCCSISSRDTESSDCILCVLHKNDYTLNAFSTIYVWWLVYMTTTWIYSQEYLSSTDLKYQPGIAYREYDLFIFHKDFSVYETGFLQLKLISMISETIRKGRYIGRSLSSWTKWPVFVK